MLAAEMQPLRRIADRAPGEAGAREAGGDEFMMKDGHRISKFSRSAARVGGAASQAALSRAGEEEPAFPLRSGAPRAAATFKQRPYTYELLPEYRGPNAKPSPPAKAANWEGKTAACSVVRGFVKSTPAAEAYIRLREEDQSV